jgi:hypothetical protein
MSRKHAHRADNQPVTRRYVRSVVQRARDEIISAIVGRPVASPSGWVSFTTADEIHAWPSMERPWRWADEIAAPSPERLERAVNGRES